MPKPAAVLRGDACVEPGREPGSTVCAKRRRCCNALGLLTLAGAGAGTAAEYGSGKRVMELLRECDLLTGRDEGREVGRDAEREREDDVDASSELWGSMALLPAPPDALEVDPRRLVLLLPRLLLEPAAADDEAAAV